MATTFALAVDAMVRERDIAFLQKIAEDYNLSFEELQEKYTTVAEAAVKVKRPYKKREPKMVEITNAEGEKIQVAVKEDKESSKEKKTCEAQTSKKEACKFSALKGGCFCKRHQRQHEEEQSGEPAPKKAKKEVVQKQAQPLHTHALDTMSKDCNLCESHGNPLTSDGDDFELVMPVEEVEIEESEEETQAPAALSAAQRLAAMLEESDEESSEEVEEEEVALDLEDAEAEAMGFGSEYEDEE
jgi:hypothetical protein